MDNWQRSEMDGFGVHLLFSAQVSALLHRNNTWDLRSFAQARTAARS